MPIVAAEPTYAAPHISSLCRPVRSATVPSSSIAPTDSSTENDTVYGKNEPARIDRPSGCTLPWASAASLAMEVRYGPRNTVRTVAEKAALAQSLMYQPNCMRRSARPSSVAVAGCSGRSVAVLMGWFLSPCWSRCRRGASIRARGGHRAGRRCDRP